MAQSIGQAIFVSGLVKAVDSSGNERILDINSMVYAGETIVTEGTDSRVLLKMDNDQSITMGRNDKLTLDSDIYDPNQMPAQESIVSVEDIQEALLNDPNFDPSQLEATAAGGGAGAPGDSSAEPVLITHDLQSVDFDFLETTGNNDGLTGNDEFINADTSETQFLFATLSLSGVDVVFEGDTALYTLTVDNAPLIDLVIQLTISHIDTDDNDITPGIISVTIPAGSTSVQFSVDTFDDFLADNNEDYDVQITGTSGGGYTNLTIGNDTQETTIIDETSSLAPDPEDPVTLKLIALDAGGIEVPANEVFEGNAVSYIVVMEDANGNRILNAGGTVEVTFSSISTTDNVDFNAASVNVTPGVSFSIDTIDDYIADNNERFTAQLTDGSYTDAQLYEAVIYDNTSVTTTIIDDSQPNTPNDPGDGLEADMESVTLKLIALDKNDNEVLSNDGVEGETAAYKVVLLDPDGIRINTATGTVQVSFTGDANDVDTNTQTVTLGQTFSTDIIDDFIADNGETFTVQIIDDSYNNAAAYENVIHDVSSITTTILDDSQPNTPNDPTDGIEPDMESVTIKLIALDELGNEVNTNTIAEGGIASYIAVLEDPMGNRIAATGTVEVTFTGVSATEGVDFIAAAQTVTLGIPFSTASIDDYLADNGETFTAQIVDDTYSNASVYENVIHDMSSVTTTILDDSSGDLIPDQDVDTVFAIITGDRGVIEGQTASYRIELVDLNGNPVIVTQNTDVTIRFNNVSTQDGDTQYNNNQTITITVPIGQSFNTFTTNTLNDQPVDSGEEYSLSISSVADTGEFERIIPGDASGNQIQVITTITDINDAPVALPDNANATEAGTASFDGTGSDADNSINATGNVLDNDNDIDTPHSQLTVSAITSNDSGNTSSQTANIFTIAGKYGVLNINTDGTFEYVINDLNTDVEALNLGDILQESFDYTVNDNEVSGELTDIDTLSITIRGTNDAPDARADIGPVLTESETNVAADTVNQVSGNLLTNDTDVDNDISDFSVTNIAQGLGLNVSGGNNQALVMAESGNPALLGGATQVSLSIGLSSIETGQGGILSYASSTNNNDFLLFMSGNSLRFYLGSENIDTGISRAQLFDGDFHQLGMQWDSATGQAQFYLDSVLEGSAIIGQGHTIGSNGTLMFAQEQDSVGGNLDANQVISANFHSIDITTNATASSSAHWNLHDISGGSSLDQSGNYSLLIDNNVSHSSGTTVANSSDVELIENLVPITISGAYGELTINADGTYSYDLYDNVFAVDALNVGDQLQEKFTYTMTDNEAGVEKYDTAVLTLTIQGSNDAPIVFNDTATAYEEGVGHGQLNQQEDAIQALGNVLDNDQDVDNSSLNVTEINSQNIISGGSQTIVGTYGSLQIFSDGHYIYTVNDNNAAVDALNVGDSLTESFNYTASDGSLSDSGQLAITIQGRDDRPDAQGNSNTINELRDDTTTINEINGNLITDNDLSDGLDSDVDNAIGDLFIAENASDSGVAINASGGNNQGLIYNELTGNRLLSGAQTVDVTMTLSSTETGNGAILSFASSANNNDFLLFMSGNSLSLYLGGPSVNTGISRTELFDGNIHTLQTTWDSTTGQADFYLDGNLEGSVITQQGYTLGNGVITLAQEQDSIGGNFDASQAISATYFDVQITTDISSADWAMDSVAGGVVTDINGLHDFVVDNNITHNQNSGSSQNNNNDIFVETSFDSISDPTTIVLQYGTLILYADGRYSYELDDTNAVVQALNNGQEMTETYTYSLSDGQKVDTADLDIKIIGTNDSPILDLGANSSTGIPGTSYQTTFTENQAPVSIAYTNSLITDVDDLNMKSARIVIKNYDPGEDVISTSGIAAIPGISILSSGIVGSDYVIELTGSAAKALYQQAIESITYANTSELPDESRQIQVEVFVIDDNGLSSNVAVTTIHLNAAPDPIDDTATVVEGQITISDNVLGNDLDQGTPAATVLQFTYNDESGNIQTANAGDVVDTQFGHDFTINANGVWSYTSDQSEFHRDGSNVEQNTLLDEITYTLIDSNGDVSNPAKLDISVIDTAPVIGDPVDNIIDEKYLATGSEPDPSATSVIGTLDLTPGADTFDTTFVATQSAPAGLTSTGLAISYSVDLSGHILTASTINGAVFTVTLVNPQAANASYEFELLKALDNINSLADIPLNFDIQILDSDGDIDLDDFSVSIIDDVPPASKQMTLDEDSSDTITTSADATQLNTSITTQADYGNAVINPDGTLTYTPSGNYSGTDTVIYTTEQDDGSFKVTTVDIIVNPVADLPGMGSNTTIDVYEDDSYDGTNFNFNSEGSYQVALGLTMPVQNDAIDQNNLVSGDSPERMELIRVDISNAAEGQVVDSSGNVIINSIADNNEIYSFYIVDNIGDIMPSDYHYAGLNTSNAIAVTQAQYESLHIIAKEDDAADDISIRITTRSHEVQDDGTLFNPDISSDEALQVVTLKVHAVTDPVSVEENQLAANYDGTNDDVLNITINEDETLDLRALLLNSFGDSDGSEEHYFDVEGLVPGTVIVINGVTRTADSSGDISQVRFNGDDTELTITPPQNWDGDMNNITIKLTALDTDDAGQVDAIQTQDDTITLNLTVIPVAGDVEITTADSGVEDTAIYLFKDVNGNSTINTTDNSGNSSDNITGVKILTSTLEGSITTDNGTPLPSIVGAYTIFDPAKLADYKITPPSHSSADLQLTLVVETTDGPSVVSTTDPNYIIEVTPVAERISTDTDGDSSDDLSMNLDHNFADMGNEDEWFNLDRNEFDIDGPWSNQDADPVVPHGSEETFASFSAEAGSQFRYFDGVNNVILTVTTNQPFVDVPIEYLDTVAFKAPSQKDGDFTIIVKAKTIDHDEDDPTITNTQISGQSTLTLHIDPVADQTTVSLTKQSGLEDAGRDASGNIINNGQGGIALDISVLSDDKDGSESYTLKIDSITDGAVIFYDGIELFPVNGMVEIADFDNTKSLNYVPGHNDNNDEILQLSAKSTEGGNSSVYSTPINMEIQIKGVADAPVNHQLNIEMVEAVDYNEVTIEDNLIDLNEVFVTPNQIHSYDNDGSETLSMVLTGLPVGFDVQGAQFMGGSGLDRQWIFNTAELQNIKISSPENYSGQLSFTVNYIDTENDGDTYSEVQNINVLIKPETDAILLSNEDVNEDIITRLDFSLDQQGDGNEFLSAVWIDNSSIPAGAQLEDQLGNILTPDIDGFIKLSDSNTINNVYIHLPEDSDMPNIGAPDVLGGFDLTVRYEVTDPSNDNSVSPAVTMSGDTAYTVTVHAIADKPVLDVDTNNLTTFNEAGVDYIAVGSTPGQDNEYTFSFELASKDLDGSETASQFRISGVPDGMFIKNGTYAGDVDGGQTGDGTDTGIWYIDFNNPAGSGTANNGVSSQEITFILGPDTFISNNDRFTIEVTGANIEHRGGDSANSDPYLLNLGYSDSAAANPPTSTTTNNGPDDFVNIPSAKDPINVLEDSHVLISDMIDAQQNDMTELLSINIYGLPPGTVVSGGRTETDVNGNTFWVATSMNAQIIFPDNFNDNNRGTSLDNVVFNITSSEESGESFSYTVPVPGQNIHITPVTDSPEASTNLTFKDESDVVVTEAQEDGHILINIDYESIDNSLAYPDPGNYAQAQNDVAIQLIDGQGVLQKSDGSNYPFNNVTQTWAVPVADLANLQFVPDTNFSGDVKLQYTIESVEINAANIETVSNEINFEVMPVVDGYNIPDSTLLTASGDEDSFIAIDFTGVLVDSSEDAIAAILNGVPVGMLVYIGDDVNNLTAAKNAGGDNNINNWNIEVNPDGTLPKIWVKPELNSSGQINGISLTTIVADGAVTESFVYNVQLDVNPVADGLTMSPTNTFGVEGNDIPINLNIMAGDLDTSETVSLTLEGLGNGAVFKVNNDFMDLNNIIYDQLNEVYTLTNIPVAEIATLAFLQESFNGTVHVEAWTVETGNNDSSPLVDGDFNVAISPDPSPNDTLSGTNANDTLVGLSGNDILSGLDGDDILYAGTGDDEMTGGSGLDKFVSSGDSDMVADYNQGEGDVLVLSDLLQSDEPYLLSHLSVEDDGLDNVKIKVLDELGAETGHSVVLDGVSYSGLGVDLANPLGDLLTKVDIDDSVV